jgi:proteasome lid subunit RPN8/RPN11
MLKRMRNLLSSRRTKAAPGYRPVDSLPPFRLVIAESALDAVRQCIAPEIAAGHEGIAYLVGQTNGETTLVMGAIRPEAHTTPGSFDVSPRAMAKVVRRASDAGLQVAGQIHTHPREAFHSDGDIEGARIAYDGFVSIVVPNYGRHLPSLKRSAAYFYRNGVFTMLGMHALTLTNGRFEP